MESTSVTQSMSSLRGTARGDLVKLEFIKNGKQCSCYMCRHSDKGSCDEPCSNCIDSIFNPEESEEIAPYYEETAIRRKYASLAWDDGFSKRGMLAEYLCQMDDATFALMQVEDRIDLAMKSYFGSGFKQCVRAARNKLDDAVSNYIRMIEMIVQAEANDER